MPHYRIYSLDDKGRILLGRSVQCVDDRAARVEAELQSEGRPFEVWEGTRLVALLQIAAAA